MWRSREETFSSLLRMTESTRQGRAERSQILRREMEVNRGTQKIRTQKLCLKAPEEAAEEDGAEAQEVWAWAKEEAPEEAHLPQTAPFPSPEERY